MYSIELLDIAIEELEEAFNWYEDQLVGLGYDLSGEIDEYLDHIKSNPYQFAIQFSKRYRFATLSRFPYQIIYFIDEDANQIFVISIFHASRKPKRFKG